MGQVILTVLFWGAFKEKYLKNRSLKCSFTCNSLLLFGGLTLADVNFKHIKINVKAAVITRLVY